MNSASDGDRRDSNGAMPSGASARDPLSAPDPLETELSSAADRVVVAEWSRRILPVKARMPEVRIGKR